jgi:uncharacterized phage-like protein YoqJ
MINKAKTCCFTGHRQIPREALDPLRRKLEETLEGLIAQDVVYYGCGGAVGFDTLAGFAVLRLKARFPRIKLILVLPCRDQDMRWSETQKADYRELLAGADKITYVSEAYFDGCMQKRNRRLAEHSGVCVAYMTRDSGGTAYTVRCARERGGRVINLGGGNFSGK